MHQKVKKTAVLAVKLGVTAAITIAIAWAVGVLQFDGEVQESEAHITDMRFFERSNPEMFQSALDNLGHDKPRAMSINGNTMFFSTATHRKKPEQLVREYQEEFVRQGLQDQVYAGPLDSREKFDGYMRTSMTGGLVPMAYGEEYASLAGAIPGNDATTKEELKNMHDRGWEPHEWFKGHHFVEMFYNEKKHQTRVTASWSDENFDVRKMPPNARSEGVDTDVQVPACPGCVRVNRSRSLVPGDKFSANSYSTPRSIPRTMEFYADAMPKRGWKETESSAMFRKMRPYVRFRGDEAQLLSFARGKEFLTILIFPADDGDTLVQTAITD